MPTQRGFVERLEVGRAGLVTASLLHDDGSRAAYQIRDLDADPERFNERLSKLGLLRDALDRAEPVEIAYTEDEKGGARLIDQVARITRDLLAQPLKTEFVEVMIVGLVIRTVNQTGAFAEATDVAQVATIANDGSSSAYVLNLQAPERAVAQAQLAAIRQAQADGASVTLEVDAKTRWIVSVREGGSGSGLGWGKTEILDGFVEDMSHLPLADPFGLSARVGLTTAPPFAGSGNVVDLIPFTPKRVLLSVVQGSPEWELLLAALRDELRVRVYAVFPDQKDREPGDIPHISDTPAGSSSGAVRVKAARIAAKEELIDIPGKQEGEVVVALTRGVELEASLVSASRPVWIQVSRKSLDVGPEAKCAEGLPSSDLNVQTLRDLRLPYSAEWVGQGCFNHGVYRFQFALQSAFEVYVDGEPLCIHASDDNETQFAHACLCGEHLVRIVLCAWTCSQQFAMDVYRIR